MKKRLVFLIVWSVLAIVGKGQTIYDIGLNDIDGNPISLSAYEGKRVLFFIAPISGADSLQFKELDSFYKRNADSIQIIGVLSIEDGYSGGLVAAVKSLYQSKGIPIVLTTGMHTKKSSGGSQSALMKLLTDRDENKRFDLDAGGVGHKFFINKRGKLAGSFSPSISLFDPICDRLVYLP